jgi:hypothetical protein
MTSFGAEGEFTVSNVKPLRNEPTAKLNPAAPDLFESADFPVEGKQFRSSTSNPQDHAQICY